MSEAERRSFVEKLAREAIDSRVPWSKRGHHPDRRRRGADRPSAGCHAAWLDAAAPSRRDNIENININGCDNVWVKRADGTKEQVEPIADSDEDLVELVQRAARAHHTGGERRIDSAKPIVATWPAVTGSPR